MPGIWLERNKREMKISELSKISSVSKNKIRSIEKEEYIPDIEDIKKLCKALDLNIVDELEYMGFLNNIKLNERLLNDPVDSDIRKEISIIRKRKGISREKLSEKTGISFKTIKAFENRENSRVNLLNIFLISEALNISTLYILIREGVLTLGEINDRKIEIKKAS